MKAKIISIIERSGSATGAQRCYLFCFKGEDGKSYRTWTDDRLGNFKRWYNVITAFQGTRDRNEELVLDGLNLRRWSENEIDADSQFKITVVASPVEGFTPNHEGVTKTEIERKDLE